MRSLASIRLARAALAAVRLHAGAVTLLVLLHPPAAAGQAVPGADGWNDSRSLAFVERMIEARRDAFSDSTLRTFEARAQGHVYFLAEFGESRQVARADQIALDILWASPNRAVQTIVGRRHEKRLPTDVQYHTDHLGLILDNFGNRISLGEGDEVRGVLHPAAPTALDFYEYRLVDSLLVQFDELPHRVYRLQVRPAVPDAPALVGTVDMDSASGAIARLTFTFTRSAYLDRTIDYVNADLRSGLWEGRYWLPAEQELEIRRQVAWLAYPVGGVIRTQFEVLDYRINETPRYSLAPGQRIASLPASELETFDDWESRLEDGPAGGDERSGDPLAGMRRLAEELVGPQAVFGDTRLKFYLPSASEGLRYRRAEGFLIGGGASFSISDRSALTLWAGYPFGRDRLQLSGGAETGIGAVDLELGAHLDRLADIGPFKAASGAGSSIGAAFEGDDFTDPYFETGVELSGSFRALGGRVTLGAAWLRQDTAWLAIDTLALDNTATRPVRRIEPGDLGALRLDFAWSLGGSLAADWRLDVSGEAAPGGLGDFGFTRLFAELRADGEAPEADWGYETRLAIGLSGGTVPAQRLYLIGGRGTLPGYAFRPWGGDRIGLLEASVSRAIVAPWVRLRLSGAAGWTDLTDVGSEAASRLAVFGTGGVRPALGIGLGLFYDLVRLDLNKGTRDGDWEFFATVKRSLWPVL